MKAVFVTYDWKQGGEQSSREWINACKEFGLIVLKNPIFEDTDMFGYIVVDKLPTKKQFNKFYYKENSYLLEDLKDGEIPEMFEVEILTGEEQ